MLAYVFKSLLFNIYENYKKSEIIYKNLKRLNKDISLNLEALDFKPSLLFTLSRQEIKDFFNNDDIKKINFELFKKASFSFKDLNIKTLQFILTHIDTIQEWLASDKFKELYLETKHPYPALLDCDVLNENLEQEQKSVGDEDKTNKSLFVNKSLSYADIEADIAWELNLRLPKYSFCFLAVGLSGGAAMESFLKHLNYAITETIRRVNLFQIYKYYRLNMGFIIDCYDVYSDKFFALLHPKTVFMAVLRDPISRLKTGINHGWGTEEWLNTQEYSIEDDIERIVNRAYYVDCRKKNDFWALARKWCRETSALRYDFYNNFFHTRQFYMINFEDILPQRAFKTMQKISQDFGFNPPEIKDKTFFEETKNGYYRYILPFTFKIDNFRIYVNLFQEKKEGLCDIKHEIFTSDENLKSSVLNELGLSIDIKYKTDFLAFKQSDTFIKLQKYMKKFVWALEEKIQDIKNKRVTQVQVLNLFKEDKELRIYTKKILDIELVLLKQRYPNFISSWRDYNEFEKMCEDLDGKIEK